MMEPRDYYGKAPISSQSMRTKLWYTPLAATVVTIGGVVFGINEITLINNNDPQFQRLTNLTRNVRLKGRVSLYFAPDTVASTTTLSTPQVRLVVYREKLPVVPGTPMVMVDTGQQPPDGTTYCVFNRLGQNTSSTHNATAVRDPLMQMRNHVYYDKMHTMGSAPHQYFNAAGPLGTIFQSTKYVDFDIHLDFDSTYANTSATCIANALWLGAILDQPFATNGGQVAIDGTTVLEFCDMPEC